MEHTERSYVAFAGTRLVAAGDLQTLLTRTKQCLDGGEADQVLIFEDDTGRQVDFNFHGTLAEVLERELPTPGKPGPGRPKLGVVSREVSLLPRHWEWLEQQPNGISAALRRMVEEARKREPEKERARRARDATSRFMGVVAGNLPDYEEASRALFTDDRQRFAELTASWPEDVRAQLVRMLG